MGKIEVKELSKKQVNDMLLQDKPELNEQLSDKYFASIYLFKDGRVMLVNEDGKGGLWKSLNEFNSFSDEDILQVRALNLEGWLDEDSDVSKILINATTLLSSMLDRKLDYSEQSLKAISKIKIKNFVEEKEVLYAILIYSCGYYVHNYGGQLSLHRRDDYLHTHVPIVLDSFGRTYTPYAEYLKSITESSKISLIQSIELERIKYNLLKE